MTRDILLVEPDYYTRYPPLGLLKLAALHRLRGDRVRLVRGLHPLRKADQIYVTSLFSYAWRPVHHAISYYRRQIPAAQISLGGIYASLLPDHAATAGADEVHVGLHHEAEEMIPAWDLVPEWDASILFASRGCVRKCGFCSVPKLEGPPSAFKSTIRSQVYDQHSRIILWDNNILGNWNWNIIMDELLEIGKEVDFNQGLDARLITDEMAAKLAKIPQKSIRLAYDYSGIRESVKKGIERLADAGVSRRRIVVYTLYNYIESPEDFLEKVRDLLSWGVISYPMRFEPLTSLTKNAYVSPKWTREQLELVAQARRVMGAAGSFPPYKGLVKKIAGAKNFEEAFTVRARGAPKHNESTGRLGKVTRRFGGDLDWRTLQNNGRS